MSAAATTRLLLIRHAEVEEKYQRIFGGRIDMNLSPRGHEQAAVLARYLRHKPVSAVYASPMKRVQQTLVPFATNGAPRATILDGLREVDFGDWTGHGWEAIREKFGYSAYEWLDLLEQGRIPNAEPPEDYRARVAACARDIIARHPGEPVAVFCHGGVVRMMLSVLLDLPLPKFAHFDIDYASLTEVEMHTHRKPEVRLLNFTPWRDWPQATGS
jgi:broad specificity phosphatase PhoE